MNKLINKLFVVLFIGLIYLNPVQATNLVCSQDLDGNGDVLGVGENASCSTISAQSFCSVGANIIVFFNIYYASSV